MHLCPAASVHYQAPLGPNEPTEHTIRYTGVDVDLLKFSKSGNPSADGIPACELDPTAHTLSLM